MLNIRWWNLHRPQVWCLLFVVTSPLPFPTWPLQHRQWQPPSHKKRYISICTRLLSNHWNRAFIYIRRCAGHFLHLCTCIYVLYHMFIYFSVVSRANWSSSVSRTECCGPSTHQCRATGQPWRYWGERGYQERYGHPSEKGMFMYMHVCTYCAVCLLRDKSLQEMLRN